MGNSLNIAATGMAAQQTNVEVIANNIANLNTTAFKRQRAEFQDLMYQTQGVAVGSSSGDGVIPNGIQLGVGVKTGGVYRIHGQGAMIGTDNPLDIAINGRGYFKVQMPNGDQGYTRAGSFQLSPTGQIVTSEGYLVDPGLQVPADTKTISISDQGLVQVTRDGQIAPSDIGRITMTVFPNDAGLQSLGGNFYLETAASGAATDGLPGDIGYGSIRQGFLEASNVDMVAEITTLIAAQRAYEMNSKVIQTSDEMLRTTTQMR